MAKTVEMTFAIGATLAGSFTGVFGKAGQALGELQKQTSKLHKASGQIGAYQKMQGSMAQTAEKLNAARMRVKELSQQMRSTNAPTDALKRQFTAANVEAYRLQTSLGDQRKKLSELRTELSGAGVDTKNLAAEQSRLTAQSQRAAEAQTRLQNAQARLAETRQRLSWNNIKGDVMSSAAMAYSLYKPVSQASDFESAMARVNAVAFSGGNNRTAEQKAANAEALKALEEQARELGRATQYTAVQAAQTQENLARAGFSSNEIISAMPGLLNMAAAEGMDLANAADIAASTLRGFNLSADQTNRVADVLAQTSAASNTSIAALGDSMKYVAPVASGLGISVEEVSAMLGVMANAGIKGSQGGTALRAALNRLSKEPKAVEKALAELGIKSRDTNGNMRDMTELLTALQSRLKGMGSADQMKYLSNIFGSEAGAGMLAVMNSAVDGTLGQLKLLNYESNGILNEISSHIKIPIEELRAGMENALPAAQHLGISYKDLSVYLGMLAKGGKQGAEVDKALTIAFDRLAQKPGEVQKALKQFNISAFDDKGKLREMPVLMTEISKALMGIEQGKRLNILEQIFGKNSGETMQVLMKGFAAGAEKEITEVANKAKGVSAEMMEKQLATLSGQWAIATSAMQDFMIEVGNVLLPYVTMGVKAFSWLTSGVTTLMKTFPLLTKVIVTGLGAIATLKIVKTIYGIGGALLSLPGAMINVVTATREAQSAAADIGATIAQSGKKAGLFSKITQGLSNGAKGIGKAFMSVGKGIGGMFKNLVSISVKSGKAIWDITKMSLYHAKQIVITAATKAWAAAQGLWNLAMKAGKGLLDVAKLALYYGKQILITTATKAWTAAQWLWNAALNANPIGLIVAAIAGAIAIGYTLYKNWDSIKALGSSMWAKIQSAAQAFVDWWNSWTLRDIFDGVADFFGIDPHIFDGIVRAWEATKGILADSFNALCDIFVIDFSGFFSGLADALEFVRPFLSRGWEVIKGIFTLDFSGAFNSLLLGWEEVKSATEASWEAFKKKFDFPIFASTFDFLENRAKDFVNFVEGIGKSLIGLFNLDFSKVWDGLTQSLYAVINTITAPIRGIMDLFKFDFSGIWDSLASSFATVCGGIRDAWNGVCDFIGSAWDKTAGAVNDAWSWTKGLFGFGDDELVSQEELQKQVQDITVLNKMSETFSQRVAEMTAAWQPFKVSLGEGFEQIYSTMQGVADRIRGVTIPAVSELTNALSKIASEINSIVQAGELKVKVEKGNSPQNFAPSYMRGYATGGFINYPQIALIGEAGREAVIPLEDKARGIPLWKAAGEEMGLLFGNTTNNNDNRSNSVVLSPSFNITVNGGEQGIEQKFRQIIEDVLNNLKNDMERVSFA